MDWSTLHVFIAREAQAEFEESLTPHGVVADVSYLGIRIASRVCSVLLKTDLSEVVDPVTEVSQSAGTPRLRPAVPSDNR